MRIKKFLATVLIAIMAIGPTMPIAALAEEIVPPPDTSAETTPAPAPAPVPPAPAPTPVPDLPPVVAPDPPAPTPAPAPPAPAPETGPGEPTGKAPVYAFNDSTRRWEPTILTSFSWNSSNGLWESPFYTYDPVVGWYHVKQSTGISDSINGLTAGSADPAAMLAAILGINDPAISNTGPNSNNQGSSSSSNSLLAQLINNANIWNLQSQTSTSGAASVSGNNGGGNATTGAASVVNNLLNLLNAMWSFSSGGFSYFMQDIFGDQTGDIAINVTQTSGGGGQVGGLACPGVSDSNDLTGPNSTNSATSRCDNDITVRSQSNGSIVNDVDMLAASGDASVSANTRGGNAMSGDARATLNIINLINSAIGAGQSFFGMINIYGNLNGDILFPGLNLNGAVGSSQSQPSLVSNTNTGPNSTNSAGVSNSGNVSIENSNEAAFNNNVNATAASGVATVANNTEGGSSQSGTAETNSSIFNLFDTSVFGDSAVLVIINDMGRWVGRIMNLDVSGVSGGGLLTSNAIVVRNSDTGPGSNNTATATNSTNVDIENSNTGSITNNVNVTAVSGAASVTGNTQGGNATSGNASVATNIANIFGSKLSLKKVFGILIINVFGSWNGSVGVDTEAGNSTGSGSAPGIGLPLVPVGSMPSVISTVGSLASYVTGLTPGGTSNSTSSIGQADNTNASIADVKLAASQSPAASATKKAVGITSLLLGGMAAMMLLAGMLLGLERRMSARAQR